MVTLKEIAAECGVSIASVSKAMNYQPDVGAKTAERIRRKAKEMGYRPNAAARTLKTNRTYAIGLLYEYSAGAGLANEHYAEMLDAIKNEVESSGYVVVFLSRNIGRRRATYLENAQYLNCDGVVIVNADYADPGIAELANSKIPVVTVDYIFNSCSAVVSDNIKGMQDLLNYVYQKGHRRIAMIHGEDTAVTRARLASFYQFCKEQKLEIPEEYVVAAAYHNSEISREATARLLNLPQPPTCILYPDDISMLGGGTEIRSRGLSVGEDISIAGYDGIRMSREICPVMTTLRQSTAEMGVKAAKLLMERIDDPKTFIPKVITIQGELQTGASVRELSPEAEPVQSVE